MSYKNMCYVLLLASCLTPLKPASADIKIATVDTARLLNESSEAVSKKKELDAISQDAKKKAEDKKKALQTLETKLKEKKVQEDSKEAESFRSEAKEYARFIKDTEEDLRKRYLKLNKEISDKVLGRVATYAKDKEIDLVLDKSEKFRGPVLYGKNSVDITDEILKGLD